MLCLRLIAMTAVCWSVVGEAQTLSIPKTWTNATPSLDRQSRENLANRAATALLQHVDLTSPSLETGGNVQGVTSMYAVLTLQDYYSGNTTWARTIVDSMQLRNSQYGIYGPPPAINSDGIYWGLAYFYAYRAYKQRPLLDLALSAYNATYWAGFVTPQDAIDGSGAGRSGSFLPSASCTNDTIAGGVFKSKDDQSLFDLNMESTGPFMALAAYLYELTGDPAYQQAALLSLDFTLNFMFNETAGIVGDTFQPSSCYLEMKPLTVNQAWFIEGLSILANVTDNSTLTSFLKGLVLNVTTYPGWSSPDGVLSEALNFKGIFIRGLMEARMRNPETDLSRYIDAYIDVQYNSVLALARSPTPNDSFYSTSWSGPPVEYVADGNFITLDVLNAAFSITGASKSSNPPANMHTTASASTTSQTGTQPVHTVNTSGSRVGTIAGGAIGGGLALLALVCAAYLWRRRRRDVTDEYRPRDAFNDNLTHALAIEPFIVPVPNPFAGANLPWTSKRQHISASLRIERTSAPVGASTSSATTPTPRVDDHTQEESGSAQSNVPSARDASAHMNPGAPAEQIDAAEIPMLVGLLNNLLQDRQSQLPPRYEA
ncbi:unnamed protein product [Peniophora sp. CBMAI 1063]|nr:unnamed protein product [Peniophora sp. CBMAI 1063]